MTEETRCAIALSYLTGVGPIRAKRMLAHAGSYADVFELDAGKLSELGIGEVAIEQLANGEVLAKADEELTFIERNDIRVLDCLHPAYPKRLNELPDSPLVLYVRGELQTDPRRTVAIVGTRKPTSYGRQFCDELVDQLKEYRVAVVSGLAYGVDIAAHEACLRYGLPTIGVLAHGLGEIYPTAHKAVAMKMLEQGALMTEYPSGLRSRREFFPQRNRIIAALSDAVVVIESATRGGSMITANLAVGYNKPVFALPGRVRDPMSAGTNELIKTHRANLIQSAEDIGYILGWTRNDAGAPTPRANLLFQHFEPEEQRVIDTLQEAEELDIDSLYHRLEVESGALAALLLELEFKGAIKSLPGKRYALC